MKSRAPWEQSSGELRRESQTQKAILAQYGQRRPPVWQQGSLTSVEKNEMERKEERGRSYNHSTPWMHTKEDIVGDFEKEISAVGYSFKSPWDIEQASSTRAPQDYKYESLWHPDELSAQKKAQIESYEYNPPFRCEFNGLNEPHKPSKRPSQVRTATTVPPWAQGKIPRENASRREVISRPKTSLWETTSERKSEEVVLSGDPILDSLRRQLMQRGAMGICGLARKFKIMDDDSR